MYVDLDHEELHYAKVLLCMLAQSNSHIDDCPSIPMMVALLLGRCLSICLNHFSLVSRY